MCLLKIKRQHFVLGKLLWSIHEDKPLPEMDKWDNSTELLIYYDEAAEWFSSINCICGVFTT